MSTYFQNVFQEQLGTRTSQCLPWQMAIGNQLFPRNMFIPAGEQSWRAFQRATCCGQWETRTMGLQWQQTWQQSQINIYWHTTGGWELLSQSGRTKAGSTMLDAKSRRSSSDTKWYKADGRRTTAQLSLESAHSCAQVLLSGVAGVLFLQHFSWKAALFSPVQSGVSHIPTASWHSAGVCVLIFIAGRFRGLCKENSISWYSPLFPGTSARLRNSELWPTLAFQCNKLLMFFCTSGGRCLPPCGSWICFPTCDIDTDNWLQNVKENRGTVLWV